jgi:hypothetical protein
MLAHKLYYTARNMTALIAQLFNLVLVQHMT